MSRIAARFRPLNAGGLSQRDWPRHLTRKRSRGRACSLGKIGVA
jgi:hypothetical protein